MSAVAVILPCYGRHDQTLRVAAGLLVRSGFALGEPEPAWLAVGGPDEYGTLENLEGQGWESVYADQHCTYWQALALATRETDAPILCAVSNDVWATKGWLTNALSAYHERFTDGEGLMGFAGDRHGAAHSCHFLIGRRLLAYLGGWPTHYRHNFGDTELCLRAQALGRYGKAVNAVLEHRHPLTTGVPDDAVYAAGRAGWEHDQALFAQRQARGWA